MAFSHQFRTGEPESRFVDRRRLNTCSLSTIIICHFHLDLQRTHAHLNKNVSQDLPTISIGSFRAASQRMHDVVMSEFGGSLVDESVEAEASREDSGPDIIAGMNEHGVELEEFQSRTQGAEITDACKWKWSYSISDITTSLRHAGSLISSTRAMELNPVVRNQFVSSRTFHNT